MATVLKGAVIIRQDASTLVYRHKCESCGELDISESHGGQISPPNVMVESFYCVGCEKHQEVRIQG